MLIPTVSPEGYKLQYQDGGGNKKTCWNCLLESVISISMNGFCYEKCYTDIRVFNPLNPSNSGSSTQLSRRGLMSHASVKWNTCSTFTPLVFSALQPELWLMKPWFYTRDCLACCLKSGTRFWNGLGAVYLIVYQRSSVFSTRLLHQVCFRRSDSIRNSIFVLVH